MTRREANQDGESKKLDGLAWTILGFLAAGIATGLLTLLTWLVVQVMQLKADAGKKLVVHPNKTPEYAYPSLWRGNVLPSERDKKNGTDQQKPAQK